MINFFYTAYAFLRRDSLENLSYRLGFLVHLAGTVTNIIIFYFVAKLVDTRQGISAFEAYGTGYFPFVLVGIAIATYQSVGTNCFADALRKEQETGSLEAILLTQTSLGTVMFSGSLWTFAFATLRVVAYLLVGSLLLGADLSRMNLFASLIAVLFTVLSLAGIGLLCAGFILVYKRGNPISFVFNLGSKFLAGVYFPIAALPFPLQHIAACLPLTYALEALRKTILLGQGVMEIQSELVALFGFALIFIPIGILFFNWALKQSKRDGSLVFV